MAKINQFHVSLFAEFLAKLKATPEGNGYASRSFALSLRQWDGQPQRPRPHEPADPGGRRAAGKMRGGRHIRFEKPTPLANLHLTLLDKVGVRLDAFADSQGKVDELFDPLSL